MGKTQELLKQAHSLFFSEVYAEALFLYSQALSLDSRNIEYQLYCVFCDIGYENSEKAQNLHDYFIVEKDRDFEAAVKYVEDIINAYDGDNEKMMDILKDINETSVESLNAIGYEDFMELVETRGSFTHAYQDIMFSTKVAISSKDDLIDFIDKLIDNKFNNTAHNYLDGFNQFFSYDENLTKLYNKLEKSEKLMSIELDSI